MFCSFGFSFHLIYSFLRCSELCTFLTHPTPRYNTKRNANRNNPVLRYVRVKLIKTWSQSYQTLISSFFRFLLLSLSVCSIEKYCLYIKMAKLNSKKRKKSSFYKEKSLVGLKTTCR